MSKGALNLLAEYGGDSSDEEVPGPRVSTKRMHRDDCEEPNKRFEKLPVPNFTIENLEQVVDDPLQHDGRIRGFPHERGNWATHVYIPYESSEGMQELMFRVKNLIPESLQVRCFDDFHISLTKTVILKYHWIDSFVNTIKESLTHSAKFIIMLDSLEVYCNEEQTRTFIGLQIRTGYNSLVKLVHCLDACLAEFRLPTFYENPSFHVSIAWCAGNHTEELRMLLPALNQHLEELMTEHPQDNWYIYAEQVMCKTGHKLFQFQLR